MSRCHRQDPTTIIEGPNDVLVNPIYLNSASSVDLNAAQSGIFHRQLSASDSMDGCDAEAASADSGQPGRRYYQGRPMAQASNRTLCFDSLSMNAGNSILCRDTVPSPVAACK